MTPPVTIPEEVLAKARDALSASRDEFEERFAVEAIALAILSAQEEQREKDAKVVRVIGETLSKHGVPVAGALLESIANAIREGR